MDEAIETTDYEKLSYGKFAYKHVQHLRRKGKRRGIEVPQLNYELTKPEKPRAVFLIVAIIATVLFVGIVVGIGFLFVELIKLSDAFNGLGDVFMAVTNPEIFAVTAGLSSLAAVVIILAYVLILMLFLIPIMAIILIVHVVREIFYMATCSKEEFANGNIVSSFIKGSIVTLCVATAIFIAILVLVSAELAKLMSGIVYGGLMLVVGGLLVPVLIERSKNKKWFVGLEQEKMQNYLAHEGGLRRVKNRLRFERQMWSNPF